MEELMAGFLFLWLLTILLLGGDMYWISSVLAAAAIGLLVGYLIGYHKRDREIRDQEAQILNQKMWFDYLKGGQDGAN